MATLRKKRYVVHCCRDKYDVYIGRGRSPLTGVYEGWGNPIPLEDEAHRTLVLVQYRIWLRKHPEVVERARRELKGKVLGCWCAPKGCHGDILSAIANRHEDP